MAKILASALRPLEALFRLRGSEVGVDQLDMGSVQLVQDVSGEVLAAGRGRGQFGGWAILRVVANTASGASPQTGFSFLDPYGAASGWLDGIPEDFLVWALACWGESNVTSNGQLIASQLTYQMPDGAFGGQVPGWSEQRIRLARWTSISPYWGEGALGHVQLDLTAGSGTQAVGLQLGGGNPIPLLRGGNLYMNVTADGSDDFEFSAMVLVRALPIGVRP